MSHALELGMNRPQYVNVPEALGTALGWSGRRAEQTIAKPAIGLRYLARENHGSANLAYYQTAPQTQAGFTDFGVALAAAGLGGEASPDVLARAVVNSFAGLAPEKAKSQPASPLTPHAALLQDVRGLTGLRGEVNVGAILEQMFALGSVDGLAEGVTAAELWTRAQGSRLVNDPLLAAADKAIRDCLIPWDVNIRVGDSEVGYRIKSVTPDARRFDSHLALASELGTNNPFAWFHRAWTCVTRSEWTSVLPGRVWVDWATTVLRLGYGLGFLWESAWFELLARTIVGRPDGPVFRHQVASQIREVLPWRSMGLGRQSRDVAVMLKRRAHRADRIRKVLDAEVHPSESFESAISRLATDTTIRGQLSSILRSNVETSTGNNLWEASAYMLTTRPAAAGSSPDYYGLLQTSGRFRYPEPGTEWVAVVASLACGLPRSTTTVGDVLGDLDSMGIRPELPDLVRLLERSGLARGSADADQAVIVEAAY